MKGATIINRLHIGPPSFTGMTITLAEALEDVEISFLHLVFANKLLFYCEQEKIDPAEFDTDLIVRLERESLRFPTGHFSDPNGINRAASVGVSLAFGGSALALHQTFEVAGVDADPLSEDGLSKLCTLVYMVRCAYAHRVADPRWEVRNRYRRSIELELGGGRVEIDLSALHGERFRFDHLGGHGNWFRIKDRAVSALRARL